MWQSIKILIISWFILTPLRAQMRIVSLSGVLSEMLCDLGKAEEIVGVDATSAYPALLKNKAQLGHVSGLSAESILSLSPTWVVANHLNENLRQQLENAKVKVLILPQVYTPEGTKKLLQSLAKALQCEKEAEILLQKFDAAMDGLNIQKLNARGLFIYARGGGNMLVAGKGTMIDVLLHLAGAENAITDFSDFKAFSAEALVTANPDFLFIFDTGLQQIGGLSAILNLPGVSATKAGQQKNIIVMEGTLITHFGLRLPVAIAELHEKIKNIPH